MTDWNALRDEAYQIAKDHGWHAKPRKLYETLVLIHSEVSEAVEEMRKGTPAVYKQNGKLEGSAVEIADCIIRILDWAGENGVEVSPTKPDRDVTRSHALDVIMTIHQQISNAFTWQYDESALARCLMNAMGYCVALLEYNGQNVEELVRAKMDYNRSRPYKHGKAF